ncbi:MAG: dTDP-4-dehydrorhamnose reductase [Puia sp.]|nr:dTDP-4-dehydrorhamnose reductase [Puia sp.]
MNNKILVTGANGQLGKEIQAMAGAWPQFEFVFLTREQLSIHHPDQIHPYFERLKPFACVNCAAYTAVDKAESDKEQAYLVNAEGVRMLAAICAGSGVKFIHISTDYVFDGESSVPLREDDPTAPINVYGASKLLGEELAFRENGEVLILRTSWVYSEFGNNFVMTMIRLMGEKPSLNVINDQIGSPTYAADLADAILHILGSGKFIPGIYNYSNEGAISWYDFAVAIKELTASSCEVNAIPGSQYPTAARRPHYSLLDKSKIRETYGLFIPAWKDSLIRCLGRIAQNR